jgi:hypothetical protein
MSLFVTSIKEYKLLKNENPCFYLIELHEDDGTEDKYQGCDEEKDSVQVDPSLVPGTNQNGW